MNCLARRCHTNRRHLQRVDIDMCGYHRRVVDDIGEIVAGKRCEPQCCAAVLRESSQNRTSVNRVSVIPGSILETGIGVPSKSQRWLIEDCRTKALLPPYTLPHL